MKLNDVGQFANALAYVFDIVMCIYHAYHDFAIWINVAANMSQSIQFSCDTTVRAHMDHLDGYQVEDNTLSCGLPYSKYMESLSGDCMNIHHPPT